MKSVFLIKNSHGIRLMSLLCVLFLFNINTYASNVSSLSYPSPVVALANETIIYLSPNLSGNASGGYTITPALPAGLTFDTNTGVISGIGTVASPATNYTITAIGGVNSTTFTLNLELVNNYFNNAFGVLSFGGPGVTVIRGDNGAAITNTTTTTHGRAVGDIVVYRNVATLGQQSIDCIITTVASNVTSWTAYDQNSTSGSGYSGNDPKFFSPQVVFPTTNGKLTFNFQFILGGTYNTVTKSGRNITLLNTQINSYDIDGNGNANSQQSTEFSEFSSYLLGNPTNILTPVLNNNLTVFKSNTITNTSNAIDPQTRVKVRYNAVSNFTVSLGGGGSAFFFLEFGAGPTFTTAVEKSSPIIDLNTNLSSVNNNDLGCGNQMKFTPASPQTNLIYGLTSSDFTQLSVSIPVIQIQNGNDEELWIQGTGTNNTTLKIPLNNNFSSGYGFTIGSTNFNSVVATTTAGVRTIVFKSVTGTTTNKFNRSQAEALLDALSYHNKSNASINGAREFTVNVFTSEFKSPDAIFSANVNCVTLSGHIYHDANGMVDDIVNATGTTQFSANQYYAILVNPANDTVIAINGIAAGGAYDFGTINEGQYAIYVSKTAPIVGADFTAANFETGYVPTGEHLGNGPGTDLNSDGKLLLTIGSNVDDANFGLQIPPTTSNTNLANLPNPGGFNYKDITNSFSFEDLDGSVDSITINTFPIGANYLKIGSVYYTDLSSTCPPQVTCTPWPGTVTITVSGGIPNEIIGVDPSQEGAANVLVNFKVWDNAKAESNTSDLTLNFVGSIANYSTIIGHVWNDPNGNGLKDVGETFISPVESGTQLYAFLVQTNNNYFGQPTILSSSIVDPTNGYEFTDVPHNNDYVIRIASLSTAPIIGSSASIIIPNLVGIWRGVSTNADGIIVAGQDTDNLEIVLPDLSDDKSNMDFGIDQLPESINEEVILASNPNLGSIFTLNGAGYFPIPTGNDPEDGNLGAGNAIKIVNVPTNSDLKYNGILVVPNQIINGFNPDLLTIELTNATLTATSTEFQFAYLDNANLEDPTPATYEVKWGFPLPIQLVSFDATKKGQQAVLDWITAAEENNSGFDIERSVDGKNWNKIGFTVTQAENGNSSATLNYQFLDEQPMSGANFYRLKQVDLDGSFDYSVVRQLVFDNFKNAVHVYPNPAQNYVVLDGLNSKTTIHVINAVGQEVLKQTTESNTMKLNINTLPSGMYYIHILQDGVEVQVEKVMITK